MREHLEAISVWRVTIERQEGQLVKRFSRDNVKMLENWSKGGNNLQTICAVCPASTSSLGKWWGQNSKVSGSSLSLFQCQIENHLLAQSELLIHDCYWGGFCKEKSSRIQCVTSHYHFMSNSQIQESIKLRRRKMFLWSSWFCSLIVTLAHTACASCGFRTDLTTDQPVCHRGTRQITVGHKKNRHGKYWDKAVIGGMVSNHPISDCNGHNDQETECYVSSSRLCFMRKWPSIAGVWNEQRLDIAQSIFVCLSFHVIFNLYLSKAVTS